MSDHARLSPSGSKRWMACAGSITLEAAFPNESSAYADAGTACHTVAAECLQSDMLTASDWTGDQVRVSKPDEPARHVLFTAEMAEATQGYTDTIKALAKGYELHVEQRVEFSEFVGVLDQFGTADAIILRDDGEMGVYDLKTGYRYVEVVENTQLMLYALGAYRQFELTHDITSVRLGIYQPPHGGMREWVVSVEDLMAFAAKAHAAAQMVETAAKAFKRVQDGATDMEVWDSAFLHPNPNEDDCAFCRAMSTCPAMRRKVEDTIGAAFEVVVEEGALAVADDISTAMKATGLIEDWIKAVRAEVERRLLADIPVEGFGLQLGREGARAWTDPDAVAAYMRKTMRLPIETVYDLSLVSPTTVEKMTKKTKAQPNPLIGGRRWERLQQYIRRSPAKPSVKPVDQITNPYKPEALDAGAFGEVPENLV